jgi:hypothetical protein
MTDGGLKVSGISGTDARNANRGQALRLRSHRSIWVCPTHCRIGRRKLHGVEQARIPGLAKFRTMRGDGVLPFAVGAFA